MFKIKLKGFFSILFGLIALAAVAVVILYAAGYISFPSSDNSSSCEGEECESGAKLTPEPEEAFHIEGNKIYQYNIY
ncbi:MAG: hypothetical protein LUD22_04540 [Coprobacillus sp.]|nr:hypothetical protein [Coprobacillus sp.]